MTKAVIFIFSTILLACSASFEYSNVDGFTSDASIKSACLYLIDGAYDSETQMPYWQEYPLDQGDISIRNELSKNQQNNFCVQNSMKLTH